jgi:hypothetical protein
MNRLALIALASALAGPAGADTFELSDPANEMNQPPRAEERSEPESVTDLAENLLCTVDTASGACSCIDKVQARKLTMTQQACADRVRRSLDIHEP